jgi:hypothetical protein
VTLDRGRFGISSVGSGLRPRAPCLALADHAAQPPSDRQRSLSLDPRQGESRERHRHGRDNRTSVLEREGPAGRDRRTAAMRLGARRRRERPNTAPALPPLLGRRAGLYSAVPGTSDCGFFGRPAMLMANHMAWGGTTPASRSARSTCHSARRCSVKRPTRWTRCSVRSPWLSTWLSTWLSAEQTFPPDGPRRGRFRAQNDGGDDGNRTRVRGFADRSLTTRARRRGTQWLPREDSNLGSRIQSPLSCQLDDGAAGPPPRLAGRYQGGRKMERKTGLEPATLTLAR